MIHDPKRVETIRARTAAQLQLVSTLEAKIKTGRLPQLELARNSLDDIEHCYLAQLEMESRTPDEEDTWLHTAEQVLESWTDQLKKLDEQFTNFGPRDIEIVGE